MPKADPRAELLAEMLLDLGFKGPTRSWNFKEEGRRKVASIHAKDIYAALEVLDWDDIQDDG